MRFGASLNMDWLGSFADLERATLALEEAGLDYVTTSGHLLTTRAERYAAFPSLAYALPYRDPFVLFGYLAGITRRITFRTSILILPLLPTALVAKQAADLSLISGGRFELGVGISWQEAEYQALGQTFSERGRRFEEQLEVLRLLWSEPLVTYHGRYHQLDEMGLGQLPEQPIPLWVGCGPEPALLGRVARRADGWMPGDRLRSDQPASLLDSLAAGTGRQAVGIAGRVTSGDDAEQTVSHFEQQVAAGATEIILAARPGAPIDDGISAIISAYQVLAGQSR